MAQTVLADTGAQCSFIIVLWVVMAVDLQTAHQAQFLERACETQAQVTTAHGLFRPSLWLLNPDNSPLLFLGLSPLDVCFYQAQPSEMFLLLL